MDEATDRTRRRLTPQMQTYDALAVEWLPYVMFFHQPNFRSLVVNTDALGFRVTWQQERQIRDLELHGDSEIHLLVGGSTAFGVGATGDRFTIPSLLNQRSSGATWLNFSGRAFFSTQELMLFLLYRHRLENLRRIVLLTGVNNLMLYFLSPLYDRDLGSFFSHTAFDQMMNRELAGEVDPGSIKRFRNVFGYFLRRTFHSAKTSRRESSAEDLATIRRDVIYTLERDLANWKLICDGLGARLTFALQPLAGWVDRAPSVQERELFAELDRYAPGHWKKVMNENLAPEQYRWYRDELTATCARLGVDFIDLNEKLSEARLDGRWLFVDRVHLTDEGHTVVTDILSREVATA